MSGRITNRLALAVLIITCDVGLSDDNDRNPVDPVTIAVSIEADPRSFGSMSMWYLSVNSNGDAVLFDRDWQTTRISVPTSKMREFSNLIDEVRFFELRESYGESVPDDSEIVITIVKGHDSNRVKLKSFGVGDEQRSPSEWKEICRTLRVLEEIISWFDKTRSSSVGAYRNSLQKRVME